MKTSLGCCFYSPNIKLIEGIDRYIRGLEHSIQRRLCWKYCTVLVDVMKDAELVESDIGKQKMVRGRESWKEQENRSERESE